MIRRLNTAFVSRQTETKSLYRGLNLYNVYKDRIYNPESLVGTTFSDKAYMSTSRNRDKSINFLNIEGMPDAAIDQFIKLRLKNPEAPPPEKIITGHSDGNRCAQRGAQPGHRGCNGGKRGRGGFISSGNQSVFAFHAAVKFCGCGIQR